MAKLNLSPSFWPIPSLWICTNPCLFYLAARRLGSPGQTNARDPTFPLQLFCLPCFLSLNTSIVFMVQRKHPGWGPQSDFVKLNVPLVGIHSVSFSPCHTACPPSPLHPPTPARLTFHHLQSLFSILRHFLFYHVFLLGLWKWLFYLAALQMTLLTWERRALVVYSVYQSISELFIGTHRKKSALH